MSLSFMKQVKKILVSSCIFTTIISIFFFFFAALVNETESLFGEVGVSFDQFLFILLFSFLISLANLLLGLNNLSMVLRIVIHYATLLSAFLVVFVALGKLKISGTASLFAAISIFTLLYAVLFLICYFTARFFKDTERKKTAPEQSYKKRF